MLTTLEANWAYLENRLLEYINCNQPSQTEKVEQWLEYIRPLPIAEKTFYLAQLCELFFNKLATAEEQANWKDLKKSLAGENRVKDLHILNIFEKTMDDWICVTRKRG
ncbi:hypothetical protein ACNQFZ_19980 [Schinkia sp. CFF1]